MHVSVDGEYAFTVDESFFYSLNLKENAELSLEELNRIADTAGERRAYNYAVSLLSRREHTVKEIFEKLKRKGYTQYAEKVCERLVLEGYLSDERFAYLYVRELVNLKCYGKRRIKEEMLRKGISRELVCEVLEKTEIPESRLAEIINKKYLRYLDTEKGTQKTVNGLLRMGYSYSEIRDALREVANENEFYEVTDE